MRPLDIRVTGTVRPNRTGKCPRKEDKTMKKEMRGEMDYRFDDEGDFVCKVE